MIRYIDYSAEEVQEDCFFQKIALVAHNCYQVTGKTADDIFVRRLIENRHLAMTEHYVFHFWLDDKVTAAILNLQNPYLLFSKLDDGYLLTCSIRPLLENDREVVLAPVIAALPPDIKGLFPAAEECSYVRLLKDIADLGLSKEETERHIFVSIKLVTDRGVSHEIVRHRPCSFAQESTRYCNYSKDKFLSSLAIMRPVDYERYQEIYDQYFQQAEDGYFALIRSGATPDVARSLLPNALKTSIIVTASLSEWRHIFALRLAPTAHRDMRLTMRAALEIFHERGYFLEQA